MAQLPDAGRVLEKLALKDAKSAIRWKELAADFYTLSGQFTTARRIYTELKAQAADAGRRTDLTNKIYALERSYGTEQSRAALDNTLVSQGVQPYANQSRVKAAEDLLEKGAKADAFAQARHLLGNSTLTPNEKARVRLIQAKVLEQEFRSQSVKSRVDRVATVIAIKTEKLQKVQEALQGTIKYGDPEVSLEAFERLYGCYAHYVEALRDMPTPTGVSDSEATAFRQELGTLVIPIEEKSVDTLAQAVQFANKQTFLDGRAAHLADLLAKVNHQTTTNVSLALHKPTPVVPLLAGGGR